MYEVGDILYFYKDRDIHYNDKPYWRLVLLTNIERSDWDFYYFLILDDTYKEHGWDIVKRID